MGILAWTSMWIYIRVWMRIEYWLPKFIDIKGITVDFWKSMYGYAVDSRTRENNRLTHALDF